MHQPTFIQSCAVQHETSAHRWNCAKVNGYATGHITHTYTSSRCEQTDTRYSNPNRLYFIHTNGYSITLRIVCCSVVSYLTITCSKFIRYGLCAMGNVKSIQCCCPLVVALWIARRIHTTPTNPFDFHFILFSMLRRFPIYAKHCVRWHVLHSVSCYRYCHRYRHRINMNMGRVFGPNAITYTCRHIHS